MTLRQLFASLVEANARWFRGQRDRRLIARSRDDFTGLYERVHAEHEPVFVLSPGRSGSLLMTRMFSLDRSLEPLHEPLPELGWHNAWALAHPEEVRRAADFFDAARYEFIRDAHLVGRRYVETNNRCTFFARAIALLYPRARFIHLVRHPVSFVRSGLTRGWYTKRTLYDDSRPSGRDDEWEHLDRVEKVAWLWQATHEYIDAFKSDHEGLVHTVVAEELFSDEEVGLEVFRFLRQPVPAAARVRRVVRKRVNASTKGTVSLTDADEQRILARTPSARMYYPELGR